MVPLTFDTLDKLDGVLVEETQADLVFEQSQLVCGFLGVSKLNFLHIFHLAVDTLPQFSFRLRSRLSRLLCHAHSFHFFDRILDIFDQHGGCVKRFLVLLVLAYHIVDELPEIFIHRSGLFLPRWRADPLVL